MGSALHASPEETGGPDAPPAPPLPDALRRHPLLQAAWEGIDPARVWDVHAHLAGTGDSGSGIWINPAMESLRHPVQWVSRQAIMLGARVAPGAVDQSYVTRALHWMEQFPPGAKMLLMAFDRFHHPDGRPDRDGGPFIVPNRYAAAVAARHPQRLGWLASVHPYREDLAEELAWCAAHGAQGVKWLPQSMGMDPQSPLCDRFYAELARLQLPLLCHTGHELAVHGWGRQEWANPLRLRRAMEHGVTVIMAHCAALGQGVDYDRGENGPRLPNHQLFYRLLDDPRYRERLYGDISALPLANRRSGFWRQVLERDEHHPRLLNGSDHPLPGVVPIVSLGRLVLAGVLPPGAVPLLVRLRHHNPLLFDFVLKRTLRLGRKRLPPLVFETRRVFPGGQ